MPNNMLSYSGYCSANHNIILTCNDIGIELSNPDMSIGKAIPYQDQHQLYSALNLYFLPNNGSIGT
jgi:hypothetical protein